MSRGCGAAKMEPAAAGPGPLIVNNKQPQPPPPPPPATAQPPPGAPRAAGGLLPGGKAREFNRNQRKDSEVRAAGGRGWHRAGDRGGPGRPGRHPGPAGLPDGLTGALGAVTFLRTVQLARLAAATAPGRKARSPVTNSAAARGEKVPEPGTAGLPRGRGLRHSPPGVQNRWSACSLAPHPFRPLILGGWWATPVGSEGTPGEFSGRLEQSFSL